MKRGRFEDTGGGSGMRIPMTAEAPPSPKSSKTRVLRERCRQRRLVASKQTLWLSEQIQRWSCPCCKSALVVSRYQFANCHSQYAFIEDYERTVLRVGTWFGVGKYRQWSGSPPRMQGLGPLTTRMAICATGRYATPCARDRVLVLIHQTINS